MLGKTHMIIGCGVGILISSGAGIAPAIAGGFIGALAGLLPDIDHPNSRINRTFFGMIVGLPFRLAPHRTITHAIWIPLALVAVALTYPHWATITIAGAYVSHILADMITPRGVPLLYPVSRRAWGLGLVRTGGKLEQLLGLVMILALVIYWERVL